MAQRYIYLLITLVFLTNISLTLAQKAPAKNERNKDFRSSHSDFFHLYFPERTDLRAGYVHEWTAKEQNGAGEYSLNNFFMDGMFQASVSKDSFMSFGGGFDMRQYDFQSNPTFRTGTKEENLYKINFAPGFGTFINDDFLFWAQAKIGNYSDLDAGALNLDDYLVLGSGEFVYRINPGAQVVLGASYSNDYLNQKLLPILGLRLMSDTGAFTLAMDLPFRFRVGYYITPHIEVFGQAVAKGDRYNVRLNGDEFNVGVHDERAGGGIRFWLGSNLSLTFDGGRTLRSQLKFYTANPGQFINGDIESHWYAQSYLGVAF